MVKWEGAQQVGEGETVVRWEGGRVTAVFRSCFPSSTPAPTSKLECQGTTAGEHRCGSERCIQGRVYSKNWEFGGGGSDCKLHANSLDLSREGECVEATPRQLEFVTLVLNSLLFSFF